jgi:cyclophilin family peptidyl-prolyl cis-trans isomerase
MHLTLSFSSLTVLSTCSRMIRSVGRLLAKAYSPPNRAFMEVVIGGANPSRIEFELFAKKYPVAVENFARLCSGDSVIPASPTREAIEDGSFADQLKPQLTYENSSFHRIMKGLLVQGGDLVSDDGFHQCSVFGETFDAPQETAQSTFDVAGLLGTAVSAPHLNGSQFFIVTSPTGLPHLNGTCICFGRVIKGLETIQKMEGLPVDRRGKPTVECRIVKAGVN